MKFLLKNSNGEPSVSFTMLVTTFLVLTLWLLLSITSSIFGIEIREFPFEGATLWFGSVSALYFGRRYTERTTKSVLDETTKKEPKTIEASNRSDDDTKSTRRSSPSLPPASSSASSDEDK